MDPFKSSTFLIGAALTVQAGSSEAEEREQRQRPPTSLSTSPQCLP